MRTLDLKSHKAVAEKVRYRLRPRHEWVLVEKKTQQEEQTEGGLHINRSQTKSYQAVVLEVSDKIADLKPGDLVLISNFPMEIEDVDELISGDASLTDPSLRRNVFLVRDEEIYCRIEEEL